MKGDRDTSIDGGDKRDVLTRWFLVLAFLAVLPWIFRATPFADYLTYIVVRMMILSVYAMSFDLVFGYVDMFSLGHAALLGGGAYAVAIPMVKLGLFGHEAFPGVLVALAVGVILGFVMGFLSCRLAGHLAVVLVTVSLAEMIFLLVMTNPLAMTGAEDGIAGIPGETLFGLLNIKSEMTFYYVVLVVLCLSFLALRTITRMPFGDTLLAIRENPQRTRFLGYRVRQYRIAAFVISGFFASLAGALTAFHEGSVGPEIFGMFVSVDAFLYTLVGGPGTLIGPVLGTFIVVIAQEILSDVFHNWVIFLGLSYIAFIMFIPKGLFPQLQRIPIGRSQLGKAQSVAPRKA